MAEQSKTFYELFVDKTTKWAEHTTSHGIPNIVRTNNWFIRIMWIVFFLTSFAYCSYTIIKSLVDYAKYETTIKIDLLRESPIEFPAVTICNLNPYDYYYTENTDYINNLLYQNGINITDYQKLSESLTPREQVQNIFAKLKRFVATDTKKDANFRKNLGFLLDSQMMLSCTFNKITCDASQFSYFWSNDYGNCYTFNSGKDKNDKSLNVFKTSKSGAEYGLQLELLVGDPSISARFAYQSGIFLVVHNKSTPIYLITDGVNVPTGFDTYIPVTRTFYKRLPSPYSDCIENLDRYKKVSDYSQTLYGYMKDLQVTDYNQKLCYDLCFQDRVTTQCNCGELNVPVIKNISYCATDEQLACLSKVNEEFSTSNIDDICSNSCPVQCETIKYDLSGHAATYPTYYYYYLLAEISMLRRKNDAYEILANALEQFENDSLIDELEYLRLNIVKATVNYNDLVYSKIEDTPSITFETLLGVLGGQLGLFIGISFLSLIELLEIAFILIATYKKHRRTRASGVTNVNTGFLGFAADPYHSFNYNFRY